MMQAFIVTGCSRGLGLALTRQLLAEQHEVVGVARHAPPDLAAWQSAGRFQFIAADLADSQALAGLMTRVLAALGKAPYSRLSLINNAGVITPVAQAGDYPPEQLIRALAINLTAPMLLSNALLKQGPALSPALSILNISSGAAAHAYPGWGVYGAGKAAVDHFSRHVALEQSTRKQPARIVALYPGVVDTDMQSAIRASDQHDFPQRARFDELKRDGALSSPELCARRILSYLHSADFASQPVVDLRTLPIFQTET
jgi:hypothetical protein